MTDELQERSTMISKLVEAGGNLKVKSALNPILWMCGIVSSPIVTYIVFSPKLDAWKVIVLLIFASVPILATLFGFLYLLLNDPDKLQSEEYQIKKRSLEIIEQKGQLPVLVNTEPAIMNSPLIGDVIQLVEEK